MLNSPLPAPANALTTNTAIKTTAHKIMTTIRGKLFSFILTTLLLCLWTGTVGLVLCWLSVTVGEHTETNTHVDRTMHSRALWKRPTPLERRVRLSPEVYIDAYTTVRVVRLTAGKT